MSGEKIFLALRGIDPQYILDAAPTSKNPLARAWVKWGALAACLCLVVASVFGMLYWLHTSGTSDPTLPFHTHEFGEWHITKEATCAEMGEETRLCFCGEKEVKPVALLPHFAGAWVVEKEPTIKLPTPNDPNEREPGLMCQFCAHCGAKLDEELIPATGSLGLAYAINPDGKTFAVAGIGNCKDEDIIIPENFCGYHVTTVMDGAFMNCDTVKSVTLPDTVTAIGAQAFSFCDNLINITLPEGLLQIGEKAFWFCQELVSISVPQSVTHIGKGAFAACYKLQGIRLPYTLQKIEDNLFESCLNLEAIFLPSGLESIGASAFENCTSLQSIVIPSSVTEIGKRAFSGCRVLANVILPSELQSIEEYTFGDCFRLENIVIPQSVMRIENHAFLQCIALTKIEIPAGVTVIGANAFTNCISLESVLLPTGLERIEDGVFSSCSKLSKINISNSVRWIGRHAFSDCYALIQVENSVGYVENWAVSLEGDPNDFAVREGTVGIAASAFYNYGEFVSVTLPDTLKYINRYAFAYADHLETVIFDGNQEQWESIEKAEDWVSGSNDFTVIFTR